MSVRARFESVRERIALACQRAGRDPHRVRLIGVSKGVAPDRIREALDAGLTDLGENRVQEAVAKRSLVDRPGLIWHMVGHLQRNKVAAAIETFDIIHAIDSVRLAEALSRKAPKRLRVLLQVNVALEASKYGFTVGELPAALQAVRALPSLEPIGLMTIAPASPDPEAVRPVFRRLRQLANDCGLAELSMGMSDDFEVAVEEGATMVRIGRALFGERA
jgi:pyridoxal phosphate enzyme (YggS family)